MNTLGITLKKTRESNSLTLREVEEVSGISNAYLSQLENDKIKKPSANILYKLSNVYNIDLNTLLSAAGIIKKSSNIESEINEWSNRIAFYAPKLNEEQKKEVENFIKFKIKSK